MSSVRPSQISSLAEGQRVQEGYVNNDECLPDAGGPPAQYWATTVANPNNPHKRVTGISVCDEREPRTLVLKECCDALDLPTSGQDSRRALLRVLAKQFEVDVVPADLGILAVIGRDLVEVARTKSSGEARSTSELFIHEAARAYRAQREARAKTVLVLGSHQPAGLERLRRIDAGLVRLGYDPVLVSDYPNSDAASLEHKMLSFGVFARFVVYDSSIPSGGIDELKMCKDNGLIAAEIHREGMRATRMQSHYERDTTFIREFVYRDETFDQVLQQVVEWGESIVAKRSQP